ncbi:bacteriophage-related major tail tube FII protein [Herbaspirillum frisingense GSF30]|uniref:Bacteriophage-related major tail tube FII protein n=1 Tax=Herbaspirillum frisingense GSF30 TaxID=864073 RepID=A0AAI9ID27_9BURK|nr:phage major tail tube protein [Herbaspirillum frisingense]EOA03941.1 bacteriophage-related major tail tube FII protein [Herbaspirillum frisingense GSF30]
MGMPSKLKDFNLFEDGFNYSGQATEVTLPKLSRKMEEYRAGGMSGPVSVDFGQEAMQLEWTAGGLVKESLKKYAAATHGAVQLRFAGAYQSDDDARVQAVEVVVRGRYKEVDMGTAKVADDTTQKFTMPLSAYKLTIDGEVIFDFDFMNGIEIVAGEDRRAAINKAIGL